MLAYSKDLHLIPFSEMVTIQIRDKDSGYMYVDLEQYNSILTNSDKLISQLAGNVTCRIPENEDKIMTATQGYPRTLKGMLQLLRFITFDVPEETGQVIGLLSVMLRTVNIDRLVQSPGEFELLSFSDHILKEYQVSWQQFFSNCIPMDAIHNPDSHYNKYMFLTLAPYGGQMPMAMPPMQYPPQAYAQSAPQPTAVPDDVDLSDITWQQVLEDTNRFKWFDDKSFIDNKSGNIIMVDDLPDEEVEKLKSAAFSDYDYSDESSDSDSMTFGFDDDDDDSEDDSEDGTFKAQKGVAPDVSNEELKGIARLLVENQITEEGS